MSDPVTRLNAALSGRYEPTGPSFSTLSVTTASLPNAVPSVAYGETLTATGGDGNFTWSLTVGSLTTGLSLNTSTSDITGTPTGARSPRPELQSAWPR